MKKTLAVCAVLAGAVLALGGCGGLKEAAREKMLSLAENEKTEAQEQTGAMGESGAGAENQSEQKKTEKESEASQPVVSDNEFIREVDEILAEIEPLEPYTSIRPEEVPENAESDFVFTTDSGYTLITGYQGESTQVKIPANLGGGTTIHINSDAFRENDAITWLYLPETVNNIDKSSFRKCTALKEVYIAGVSSMDAKAFADCTALRRVEIGGCKEMNARTTDPSGAGAFSGCESLEEVVFPPDLEIMGTGAFDECIRLREADLSGTKLTWLGQNVFLDCYSLEKLALPPTMAYVNGNACLKAYSLKEIQLAEESPFFVEDNMLYGYQDGNGPNPENLECIMCLMGARASEIHVKDGTNTLSFKGIANNPFVRVIRIPDSVGRLEAYAFSSVDNLELLELGSGITYMDEYMLFSKSRELSITYEGKTYQRGDEFDALREKVNQEG